MRKYWTVPSTPLLVLLVSVFVVPWAHVVTQQSASTVKVINGESRSLTSLYVPAPASCSPLTILGFSCVVQVLA